MVPNRAWPFVSIILGSAAAGLGCYGAWEYARKLEGTVSYLVVAAPVIAGAAALIPPIAESLWRDKQRLKAILMWLLLVPTAATVFYSAAERVHTAKAGAAQERASLRSAAARATQEREEAKVRYEASQSAANRTLSRKNCSTTCEAIRATALVDKARLESAESKLLQADTQAVAESPMKAPVWLLPLALDLIAFMMIWSGLTGPKPAKAAPNPAAPVAAKTRTQKKKPAVGVEAGGAKAERPARPQRKASGVAAAAPPKRRVVH